QGARTSPRAGARVRTRRAAPAGRPGAGGMVSRLGLRLMVGVQAELTRVLDALGLTGAPSTTLDVVRRVLATHGDLEAGLRIVERLRDVRRESVVLDTPAPRAVLSPSALGQSELERTLLDLSPWRKGPVT